MKPPFASILCPVDLSGAGQAPLAVARSLCADDGVVHLVHICEPPYLGNPLYEQYVQGYAPTEAELAGGKELVRHKLEALVDAQPALGRGATEIHLVDGVNVANAIEATSRELGCEVVVMGTHGRTGLARILMGSVAASVVKKEGLPAILVHED